MVGPSSLKPQNSNIIHIFSNNMNPQIFSSPPPPSSPSSLNAAKLKKTLLQTLVFSHAYRIVRALAKAKSVLVQLLKDAHFLRFLQFKQHGRKQKKLVFGSFRLHYNWCSSNPASYVYYDSSWSSVIQKKTMTTLMDYEGCCDDDELSKYLRWLEERDCGDEEFSDNEIDRIADMFIANCHEKFRLEKQESYRMFQEMMARSV